MSQAPDTYDNGIIDLTSDLPSPPLQRGLPIRRTGESASPDQPPSKRQRVGHGWASVSNSSPIVACLIAQVLPHIFRETQNLPRDKIRVDKIVNTIRESIRKSATFQRWVTENDGIITRLQEDALAAKVSQLVKAFSSQREFQASELPLAEPTPIANASHKPRAKQPTQITSLPKQPDVNRVTPVPLPHIPQLAKTVKVERSANAIQRDIKAEPPPRRLCPRAVLKPREPTRTLTRLSHRPYRSANERQAISTGIKRVTDETLDVAQDPIVYHVDFSEEELARVIRFVLKFFPQYHSLTIDGLAEICKYFPLQGVLDKELPDRSAEDIKNFVSDLLEKRIVPTRPARVLSLERGDGSDLARVRRDNKVSSLLLARETEGNRGFGRTRSLANFQNEFQIAREDELSVIAEFTNCAGDIATISWVSTGNLICGTTVHSDSHNQQYNKPGNLLLYSSTSATLRAFPDHRVPRPLVEKGDNSTDAMRQSQDPWLYSSVVSSDYDPISNRAFTSSFDHTVKVWEVDEEGRAMKLLATWKHEGNVNFIAAAKDGSGRVASAADVPSEAVRIYTVNPYDIENSPFQAFSCSRNDAGDIKKWAYYPSCLQWGKAAYTQQLLAVGYSPRSLSGDDTDIPEDKFNTGEITVWDAEACRRIPVTTATTANVFEVTWHPTLQLFLAATSPCGLSIEHGTRTQIHIFQRDRDREEVAYCEYQSLDCKAADINGLTFMPNSLRHAYVTAACTDGKVYVWDTAWGNDPIHILRHGESLEGFHEQVETLDTGVMFMAWCKTADRLYTGSSDGVVKVWNIRSRKKPFVRNLLEAPGPISFGAFSPDHSTLAIGDATGRLYLLSHDKRDELEAHYTTLPGLSRRVRQPTPFIPHAEPPPPRDPEHLQDESLGGSIATYARRKYLESQQLVQTSNPVLGVVQGPNYASTMHYRREAHEDNDPEKPLLLSYERQQQSSQHWGGVCVQDSLMRLKDTQTSNEVSAMHERNTMKDLDIGKIASTDLATLLQEKAILSVDDWDYTYEELPAELH